MAVFIGDRTVPGSSFKPALASPPAWKRARSLRFKERSLTWLEIVFRFYGPGIPLLHLDMPGLVQGFKEIKDPKRPTGEKIRKGQIHETCSQR